MPGKVLCNSWDSLLGSHRGAGKHLFITGGSSHKVFVPARRQRSGDCLEHQDLDDIQRCESPAHSQGSNRIDGLLMYDRMWLRRRDQTNFLSDTCT